MSPKRIVAVATSVEQRARQRAPLGRLSDHLVQPATVKRYQKAFQAFLTWVRRLDIQVSWDSQSLDAILSMYIEHLWESGLSRGDAGDIISALQFHLRRRRCFTHAWSLWGAWAKLELPSRAPPAVA
eukprot:3906996-Amphidinium_carterae.1